jgi:hypothetical protein
VVGGAERLVGDGAEGERRDVRPARALDPLAGVERAQLGLVVVRAGRPHEERLLDRRHRRPRVRPELVDGDRDRPPRCDRDPLGGARLLDRRAVAGSA